jgi:hypothetical protein
VRVVTFYVGASSSSSWTVPENCVLTGLQASMDALFTLDPDGTWLDYVTATGVVDQIQLLTRSVYSKLGDPHPMYQLSQLSIELLKDQRVFLAAGPTAGLVQLFVEPDSSQLRIPVG